MGAPLVVVGQQLRQETLNQGLIRAVKHRDVPAVDRLLREGASANARDTDEPPLTVPKLLARLLARLQHKPDAVAANPGDPALLLLISDDRLYYGQEDRAVVDSIATALVLRGADLRVRGYRQQTPLADVAGYGLHHTLGLMLSKGVDVNTHDDTGLTPLMGADAYSTNLLIQYGADVRATDYRGCGTLYYAAVTSYTHDKLTIIRLLKQHGARLNTKDKEALANDGVHAP
jgi:ankyrin repeat protein